MTVRKVPDRLRCVGSRTPDCRAWKRVAYFAIVRQRPCGHVEPVIPLCRDCLGGKDPRDDVQAVLGTAGRATVCSTCGEPSRLTMRLLLHMAVPHTGSAFNVPLCHTRGEAVVLDTGGQMLELDAPELQARLVVGHTLLRSQVNCKPCREWMHA
jgi:hypothetical protein